VLIADYRSNAVVEHDLATGGFVGVIARGAGVDRPASVALGPDGLLYTAGFGRGDVVRYDRARAAMVDVFYWDTTVLEEPVELAFRGDELFVLGNDTKNVVVVDRSGMMVRELGWPTMRAAQDFALDGASLWVATEHHPELGSALQQWSLTSGELIDHFGTSDELLFASSLALTEQWIYVSDLARGSVVRFDRTRRAVADVVIEDGALLAPVELGFGPDGALYVLDARGLWRHDPDAGALDAVVEVDGDLLQRPLGFILLGN
jgi:hypothetical protein